MPKESIKKIKAAEMHAWFRHLFERRMDSMGVVPCYECHKPMHEDTYKENSCCYSHVLGKKQYPDYAGDPANVVIVHPDCHTLYTMTPTKAKNQYNCYLHLKQKYDL